MPSLVGSEMCIRDRPDNYYLGDAKTVAGEVIGQGVVVDLFKDVIESVTAQHSKYHTKDREKESILC